MNKFIVYIDDADYALPQLRAVMSSCAPTHWVLVACPPRLSRHVGKWIHRTARASWRSRWAEGLFEKVAPILTRRGDTIQTHVAKDELLALTQTLRGTLGAAPVLDMRRPKFGTTLEAVVPGQTTTQESSWQLPGAVVGMGAILVLAVE